MRGVYLLLLLFGGFVDITASTKNLKILQKGNNTLIVSFHGETIKIGFKGGYDLPITAYVITERDTKNFNKADHFEVDESDELQEGLVDRRKNSDLNSIMEEVDGYSFLFETICTWTIISLICIGGAISITFLFICFKQLRKRTKPTLSKPFFQTSDLTEKPTGKIVDPTSTGGLNTIICDTMPAGVNLNEDDSFLGVLKPKVIYHPLFQIKKDGMCTVRKYEDPDFIRLPLQPKTVGVIGTSLALFIIKMKNKDQFKGIPSARTSPHSYRPVQPILKKDDNLCVMKEVSTT